MMASSTTATATTTAGLHADADASIGTLRVDGAPPSAAIAGGREGREGEVGGGEQRKAALEKTTLAELSHGLNPLSGVPHFSSYAAHRQHVLVHMAAAFRHWARAGYADGLSGHISVRDPEHGALMWMNPVGRHFGLLEARDMVCLRIDDGVVVGGNRSRPVNNPGYYIHSELLKARPDVNAVCHAHTLAGRAWSAFGRPLQMLTQDACTLWGITAVVDAYGGIVTAGLRTVDEAVFLFGLTERCCDVQLRVEAAEAAPNGPARKLVPDALARGNALMVQAPDWLYEEAQPDIEYEIAMAGPAISEGVEAMTIDADALEA